MNPCEACEGKGWKRVIGKHLKVTGLVEFTAICKQCGGTGKSDVPLAPTKPRLKWKQGQLHCGLFTFLVERTKKHGRIWHWSEKINAWTDLKEYTNEDEAKVGCEKWLLGQIKTMNREIGK